MTYTHYDMVGGGKQHEEKFAYRNCHDKEHTGDAMMALHTFSTPPTPAILGCDKCAVGKKPGQRPISNINAPTSA